jgi:hypothetical protein
MKCSNLVRGVLCCLFFFAVTTLHAQSSPSLVEAAKKEGKLVYYTVLTLPESRALVTAFEKKYPFIKTELFRLEGDKMRAKIATEARAGRHTVLHCYPKIKTNMFVTEFKDQAAIFSVLNVASISH